MDDTALLHEVREIRRELPRLGVRKLQVMLYQRGHDVGRDRFREARSRKKGQSFHEWVHGIRMACIQLDLALSNRERRLSEFAKAKARMRSLQKDLREKKHERKD